MYVIPLYRIIVTDNATTKDSKNLVAFTINDGTFCDVPSSISISCQCSNTFCQTASTLSHRSMVEELSIAGCIICLIKSLAAFVNHTKNGTRNKANNQYFNLLITLSKENIYYI